MLNINMSVGVVREGTGEGKLITSPDDAYDALSEYKSANKEMFFVLTIDSKKRLIDKHMVGMGILDASLAHPREIFFPAIKDTASSIILAHNHPSGNPTPSAEDIKITRRLVESGKILEIPVLDHVIIGRKKKMEASGFLSIRESGLVKFED